MPVRNLSMYPICTRCSDALTSQPASNELALIPAGKQPTYPIVLEKLRFMESCIEELHEVVRRLVRDSHPSFPPSISSSVSQDKLFLKMVKIIRGLETLLHEVHKTKGWKFVDEPLWVTWSLEKFGVSFVCFGAIESEMTGSGTNMEVML